eukprot:scaffold5655_cov282-Prasinococcus_capsulatus_cf.AAC.1
MYLVVLAIARVPPPAQAAAAQAQARRSPIASAPSRCGLTCTLDTVPARRTDCAQAQRDMLLHES